ncbi:hypothetical protein MAL08_13655 [Leptospira noguchii]|uniref:hypothetical protein n=1 Tax=Leptospira noguchii TaxID=28182 RepID=UPI001FB73F1C|nr:hypothetical protein [Leptospira noguchii]UOG39599.1 hypothetical protein MAL08_13655 [Leptospira noguchii]
MERKELNETLFTKAFETQHNAFLWVALTQRLTPYGSFGKLKTLLPAVATLGREPVHYEICELRRRPGKLSERLPMGRRSGSRCT